jgi:3-oxoacyl-[acyl-carrier protein] reductase
LPVSQPELSMAFFGRSAIVTGGSGGIGAEVARRLAAAGASVVIHYHSNGAGAERLVGEILDRGGRAIAFGGDLGTMSACEALADAALAAFARIDVLVNAAGTSTPEPLGRMTVEGYRRDFDASVLSTILMKQAAVARFGPDGGRIVNVGSNLSAQPIAGLSAYAAAKAAVAALTHGFARELAGRSITVNAVAPGAVQTPMTEWIGDDGWSEIVAATPLRRIARPDDVADAVLFLASDSARWVNGRTLIVDGGLI